MDKVKRGFLEDDFFSLSSTIDRKKLKKEKHTKKKHKEHKKDDDIINEHGSTTEVSDINSSTILKEDSFRQETEDSKTDADSEPENCNTIKLSKPPVRSRTITPPSVDKEAIRIEIASRIKSTGSATPALEDTDDDNDEDDDDDDELGVQILKESKSLSISDRTVGQYQFTDSNEKKRKYIIRAISKLPVPEQASNTLDFGTGGLKSFTKIKIAMLKHFKSIFMATLSSDLLDRYSPETSALVWLEGKMLIPTFYTPKTLRIPPPASFNLVIDKVEDMQPTVLTCLLIENENSEQFMNIYPEFQTAAPISEEEEQPISEPTGADADADADADVVDEDDVVDLTIDDEPAIAPQVEEIDEFFVIGLKGKDNKRIEVKVSTETKIRSLLMHYLKVKGLDERTVDITHAKLIFDDEPLDMDAHVGDTELEEDFEIQIVL